MKARSLSVSLVAVATLLFPLAANAEKPAAAAPTSHAPSPAPQPPPAAAPHADAHEEKGEHEGEERRWVFGAAFVGLGPVAQKEEATAAIGGGVFGEYTFVPGWFQAEVGVRFLAEGKEKTVMPIDILLKKPFELDHSAEAFIAAGATIVPTIAGEGETTAGVATAVGSYFWVSQHVGLVFEVNYNLLFEEEPLSELGGAVGIAYGL